MEDMALHPFAAAAATAVKEALSDAMTQQFDCINQGFDAMNEYLQNAPKEVTRELMPRFEEIKSDQRAAPEPHFEQLAEQLDQHLHDVPQITKAYMEPLFERVPQMTRTLMEPYFAEVSDQASMLQSTSKKAQNDLQSQIEGVRNEIEHVTDKLQNLQMNTKSNGDALDLDTIRNQLIEEYIETRGSVSFIPGIPEECADIDQIFINLEILTDGGKQEVSYQDLTNLLYNFRIYKNKEPIDIKKRHNRVLVCGKPGTGKSTMISKLAHDWATNNLKVDYKLLFAIDLREVKSGMNVVDAVVDQLLPKISKQDLTKLIESNRKNILWLFDAFDEAPTSFQKGDCGDFKDVFCSKWLQESCVIMTTRIHKISDFFDRYERYRAIAKLTGFTYENVVHYVAKFFLIPPLYFQYLTAKFCYDSHYLQDQNTDLPRNVASNVSSADKFLEAVRKSQSLKQLSTTPLLLAMLCVLWKDEEQLPRQTTALYRRMIVHLAKHRHVKYERGELDTDTFDQWMNMILMQIGKAAFTALLEGRVFLRSDEIDPKLLEEVCHIGLVSKERKRSKELHLVRFLVFFHKTIQEMCAAMYLTSLAETDKERFLSYWKKCTQREFDMQYLIQFCCGVSKESSSVRSIILPDIYMMSRSSLEHTRFMLSSFFEAEFVLSDILESVPPMVIQIDLDYLLRDQETLSIVDHFCNQCRMNVSTWMECAHSLHITFPFHYESQRKYWRNDRKSNRHGHRKSYSPPGHDDHLMSLFGKFLFSMSHLQDLNLQSSKIIGITGYFSDQVSLLISPKTKQSEKFAGFFCNKMCVSAKLLDRVSKAAPCSRSELKLLQMRKVCCCMHSGSKCLCVLNPLLDILRMQTELHTLDIVLKFPKTHISLILETAKHLVLEALDLTGNELGEQQVRLLKPFLSSLADLVLIDCRMDTEATRQLFQLICEIGSTLQHVDSSSEQGHRRERVDELPLLKLDLRINKIGDSCIDLSRSLRYLPYLKALYLIQTGLTEVHFKLLGSCFANLPRLEELDLSWNQISEAVVDVLFGLHRLKHFKVLKMRGASLSNRCVAQAFGEHKFPELICLDISMNVFTASVAELLLLSVLQFPKLQTWCLPSITYTWCKDRHLPFLPNKFLTLLQIPGYKGSDENKKRHVDLKWLNSDGINRLVRLVKEHNG